MTKERDFGAVQSELNEILARNGFGGIDPGRPRSSTGQAIYRPAGEKAAPKKGRKKSPAANADRVGHIPQGDVADDSHDADESQDDAVPISDVDSVLDGIPIEYRPIAKGIISRINDKGKVTDSEVRFLHRLLFNSNAAKAESAEGKPERPGASGSSPGQGSEKSSLQRLREVKIEIGKIELAQRRGAVVTKDSVDNALAQLAALIISKLRLFSSRMAHDANPDNPKLSESVLERGMADLITTIKRECESINLGEPSDGPSQGQ